MPDLAQLLRDAAQQPQTPLDMAAVRHRVTQRRRRRLRVGASTVVAACGLAAVIVVTFGSGQAPSRVVADRHQQGAWRQIPAGPLDARVEPAVAWTGRELIVWGGMKTFVGGRGGTGAVSDGAAFDPHLNRWRMLAPSPLSPRIGATAVWTGRAVIVWAGSSDEPALGAAYDPDTNSWRSIAPSPLSARFPLAAVWDGKEVLVWANKGRGETVRDGGAYDPASDAWRSLPLAPLALNTGSAVWTGTDMIVVGSSLSGEGAGQGTKALAYNPASNTWRTLASPPLSPNATFAVTAANSIVAWDYELASATYDPRADTWTALPHIPLEANECYPSGAPAGAVVLMAYCGQAAVFDRASATWRRGSPPAPVLGPSVWTGEEVLTWGVALDQNGLQTARGAAWAYRP